MLEDFPELAVDFQEQEVDFQEPVVDFQEDTHLSLSLSPSPNLSLLHPNRLIRLCQPIHLYPLIHQAPKLL